MIGRGILWILDRALDVGEAWAARQHEREQIARQRREIDELHRRVRELELEAEVRKALAETKPRA